MQYLTKGQIIERSEKIFAELTSLCNSISEANFFERRDGKWPVAENIQHLIISTNITTLVYTLPAFIVRWAGGRPNRDSISYEALVEKYKIRLAKGGKASGRFVPKPIEVKYGRARLMQNWEKAAAKFITALKNTKSESMFDNYLARHPLLGRITLRELCYFTVYHTEHHLNIIKNHLSSNSKP